MAVADNASAIPGCNGGERSVFRNGDGLEAVHNPPNCAKQADEWRGRTNSGKEAKPAFQMFNLAVARHLHNLHHALAQAEF